LGTPGCATTEDPVINSLIPIRSDAGAYAVAILAVLALSPFAVGMQVYARLPGRRVRVLDVYAAVCAAIAGWGIVVLGLEGVVRMPGQSWPLALAPAIAAGIAAHRFDRAILRRLARRSGAAGMPAPRPGAVGLPGPPLAFQQNRVRRRKLGAGRSGVQRAYGADATDFPLPTIVAVAVLEEAVYRGVLLTLCVAIAAPALSALAVAASLAAFALAHVPFGWAHVAAKCPLGALSLVAMAVGGLPAAAAVHVTFNVLVWNDVRERS
jgi:membrane protease YdiL (CAAX protease family)